MKTYSAADICEYLRTSGKYYRFFGEKQLQICGFSSLKNPRPKTITWAKNKESLSYLDEEMLKNLLIIVPENGRKELGTYIECKEPKNVFFSILNNLYKDNKKKAISRNSVIYTTDIGENVSIGCNCYIGEQVILNDDVVIENNVVIDCPAIIGKNSIIHSGVIIGTDGFGYYNEDGYHKVPHFGGVKIGEEVEIGANTCIDRGTIDDTNIGNRVKIDNLCHIAHNVVIEDDCLVIACSLLGGSSIVKKNAYIAPGVIIKNQIIVGENSLVGMGAVVTKNVNRGDVVAGVPARVIKSTL